MFNRILQDLTSIATTTPSKKGFNDIELLQEEINRRRLNNELDYPHFQSLQMLASTLRMDVKGKLEKLGILV